MKRLTRRYFALFLSLLLLVSNVPVQAFAAVQTYTSDPMVLTATIIPDNKQPGNKDPDGEYVQVTGASPNKKTSVVTIYQEDDSGTMTKNGTVTGPYWLGFYQIQESGGYKEIQEIKLNGTVVWPFAGSPEPIKVPVSDTERYIYYKIIPGYIPSLSCNVSTGQGGYSFTFNIGNTSSGSINVRHVYGSNTVTDTQQSISGAPVGNTKTIYSKNTQNYTLMGIKVVSRPSGSPETTIYINDQTSVNVTTINGVIDVYFYYSPVISGTVTKVWDDESNRDGTRPSSVSVQLYADGVAKGSPVTLNAEIGWNYIWDTLPANKYISGTISPVIYTVDETVVPNGYTKNVTGWTITNSHKPDVTSVSVRKTWTDGNNQDGLRPTSIQVQLYKGSVAEANKVGAAQTLSGPTWSYAWTNLAKKAAGVDIVYIVDEVSVPTGYTHAITGTQATGYTITNTREPATKGVTVTKVWADNSDQDGVRPDELKVTLTGTDGSSREITLSAANALAADANTWTYTQSVPVYYNNGTLIDYSLDEEDVSELGYVKSINGLTITNTREPATIELPMNKTWDDGNNINGLRTDVMLQLYKDNVAVTAQEGGVLTLTAANGWTGRWTNLARYRDGGIPIVYTVTEAPVTGYRTVKNENGFLNTLNTPIVEIAKSVDKTQVLGGEQFAYTVTLTNRMLRDVTVTGVTDDLAAGQTFGAFTSQGNGSASYNPTTRVITWSGTVPAAAYSNGVFVPGTTSFTFTVTADELVALEEGHRLLKNGAVGTYIDPYAPEFTQEGQETPTTYPLTSNIVEVEVLGPVMSITKETSKTDTHPGETMTYTLRVQSRSLMPFQVTISDLLPSGVTFKNFVTTGYGEMQDAANLKQLSWNFTMPAATFNPDTLEVTAPSEVTLSFVVTVDAVTVDQDVVTITNNATVTPKKDDETPYDPIPSNNVQTNVTASVTAHKAASVTDMYVGDPTQDRRWVYVFTLTNSNTAPMQVNLADAFDANINFYNWVNSVSTDTSVYPRVVSQDAFQDPVTGIQSINVNLMLAPATVDSQGNVIPSEMQYAVIVEGKYIALEGNETAEIAVPNTGIYRVSTNIVDPINLQTAMRRNTNTATVIVWAINGVLPVTGEWIMLMVPFGGLMALAGFLLLLMNRRKQHVK